jgi:hypothetical protein
MNARYPASSTGMWGQVKRTQVVAAIAATVGIMVGAGGVAAWDATNDSDESRVYSPPAINIDRLAEAASRQGPDLSGATVSGAEAISAAGRGFVDVESRAGAGSGVNTVTTRSGAESISAAGRGFVDVDGEIAFHDAALTGSGIVDDTGDASSGPLYPASREGARGQVFSD